MQRFVNLNIAGVNVKYLTSDPSGKPPKKVLQKMLIYCKKLKKQKS